MSIVLSLLLMAAAPLAGVDFQMLPATPIAVFGGRARLVPVSFQNSAARSVERQIGVQLLQASSATVAPFGPVEVWKPVSLLAHQTAREEVLLPIPAVRAETRFLVRFTDRAEVLGLAEVWAYPTNLLADLNGLLDGQPLILCDGPASVKEPLVAAGVNCLEIMTNAVTAVHGRLAMLGPFPDPATEAAGINLALSWAKAGIGVIFLKTNPIPAAITEPSYYALSMSNATLVVAQANSLANLPTDPWTQLLLLRMARLATGWDHLTIPKPTLGKL